MTKVIGLTGGIGSGKSTLAKYLASEGIPVYIADLKARELLDQTKIIEQIVTEFGSDVIINNKIDRKRLAAIVFDNTAKLESLNNIIHPAVEDDFQSWLKAHQDADFVVKEAAILLETGSYKKLDAVINIEVPDEVRIKRVMARDHVSEEEVKSRMKHQFSNSQRAALATITIKNTNLENAKMELDEFLKKMRIL
jgi:dephospho-CoA kinase